MLETKEILMIVFKCALFLFLFGNSVVGQQPELLSAVVIIEKDFLRVQPSNKASSVTVIVKGTKLKAIPSSNAKGWYFAYLEKAPSVSGHIYGNSIKIVGQD